MPAIVLPVMRSAETRPGLNPFCLYSRRSPLVLPLILAERCVVCFPHPPCGGFLYLFFRVRSRVFAIKTALLLLLPVWPVACCMPKVPGRPWIAWFSPTPYFLSPITCFERTSPPHQCELFSRLTSRIAVPGISLRVPANCGILKLPIQYEYRFGDFSRRQRQNAATVTASGSQSDSQSSNGTIKSPLI